MESKVLQIRARGTLTLPAKIRDRYALDDGDPVTLVDLDGVLLIVPKVGVVDKMAAEIERLASKAGVSEAALIAGVGEERQKYYAERRGRKR